MICYITIYSQFAALQRCIQAMDGKKGSAYMEKAIQKASRLIDLLTKQNEDLKQQNIKLQLKMDDIQLANKKIMSQSQTNDQKIKSISKLLMDKQNQIKQSQVMVKKLREVLQEKSNNNKQLHEKIGQFVTKNQELQNNLNKEKKKNLCLQNENDYLVKTFSKHEMKQNQFQNYCYLAESQFKKEVFMIDRTKQAYAKKCQQLKTQNIGLRKQLLQLTQKINESKRQEMEYIKNKQLLIQLQIQIKRGNDILSYLIESTLRITPQHGLCPKIQQIKNYISYRMQHIENLIRPITDIVGGTSIKQVRDLASLIIIVNRLASYLSELVK